MAQKNQDLQPKDGDFVAYIEKLQEQKASKLKESVKNDSAQFAQELFKTNDQSLQKARENVKKAIQTDLGVQEINPPGKDIPATPDVRKEQPFSGIKDKAFVEGAQSHAAKEPGPTKTPDASIDGQNADTAARLKSRIKSKSRSKAYTASRPAGYVLFLFFAVLLGFSAYFENPFIFIAFFIFFMIGNIILNKKRNKAGSDDHRRRGPQG